MDDLHKIRTLQESLFLFESLCSFLEENYVMLYLHPCDILNKYQTLIITKQQYHQIFSLSQTRKDKTENKRKEDLTSTMVSSKCASCLTVTVLAVTCVMIVAGIIGLVVLPDVIEDQVKAQLPLTADSDQVSSWEAPPVPIYLQFWLWECVNVAEVLGGGKPAIRERGPFTYLEKRQKIEVQFNTNDTVTYRQVMSYTFQPDLSPYSENQVITMINVPYVTIVQQLRTQKEFVQELVDIFLRSYPEALYVNHTANEWIWGYVDPFLEAIKELPFVGRFVPDAHFGYFYNQNATDDGLYVVYTGSTFLIKSQRKSFLSF